MSFWKRLKEVPFRIIVIVLLLACYSLNSYGIDPPDNLFNFIFSLRFEQNTPGNYADREFYRDWLNPPWDNRQIPPQIVQYPDDPVNPTKTMQWNFPAGSLGPAEGGGSWESPLRNSYNEVYFSYDVMFKPGFQFVLGGKLPGVGGGPMDGGAGTKPGWDEGYTAGLAFHPEGKIVFYSYNQDQPGDYGQVIGWNKYVIPGKWHNLTMRVVMNTVAENGGRRDGILEGFFDGQLVCQLTNMRFRNLTSIGTDIMKIYSFFGGGDDRFRNTRDEWIRLDNFVMFTYSNEVTSVPRGNHPSSYNKKLLHPFMDFDDIAWLSSAAKGSVGSDHIEILWNPYPIPVNYTVERKLTGTSDFIQIGQLPYNSSSFNDINLAPSTSYTYRIKAGDRISNEVAVTTADIDNLPSAPADLTAEAIDYNRILLKWKDKSSDEIGFEIERDGPDNTTTKNLFIISPDDTTYTDRALQMNSAYQYRIRSINTEGRSAYTGHVQVKTPVLDPPSPPSMLKSTKLTDNSITLAWIDNSTNEKSFVLKRTLESDPAVTQSFSLSANVSAYDDTNLLPNTTYIYTLIAVNDAGFSEASNRLIASTFAPVPLPPSMLKSTELTDNSITLSWSDNSTNEKSFVLKRTLESDPAVTQSFSLAANVTSYTDTNLLPNTTYLYTIAAVNDAGVSAESNRHLASTFTPAEEKRIRERLIAYYNFHYNSDFVVLDQSGFGDPLNLLVSEQSSVMWDKNSKLSLVGNTAIVSATPAKKIVDALKKTNELTVECWIMPTEPDVSPTSRIFSLANNDDEIGVVLDQQYYDNSGEKTLSYVTRMQTESTNPAGYPEYISDLALDYINLQHLAFVHDSLGNETLYINGLKSSEGYRPSNINMWKDNFYLRLGNEKDLEIPWKGTFHSMAIYDKALTQDEIKRNFYAEPVDSMIDSNLDFHITAFPNPVTDEVVLEVIPDDYHDLLPETRIRVYDANGKVYMQKKLFNPNIKLHETVSFKSYPKGTYFLQVQLGINQKSTKIIVQ